jgi:galactose mutarotase-like enzyme
VRFDDFPHLGIWTKPGADFVCIEPWQGHSSSTDFNGNFADKPGIITLDVGEQRVWWFSVEVN